MNIKLDEVMSAYANILNDLPENPASDVLWHSTVEFPEPRHELEVGTVSLQTNAFFASAADKSEQNTVHEKMTPLDVLDMIESAHPKSVYIADAMEDGGLVENQNETQRKLVEMINKYPSGSIGHKYAALVEDLVVVAQELDASGNREAADEIDLLIEAALDTLKKNSSVEKVSWVAAVPWVVGILSGLGFGGSSFFSVINGMQENLQKDAQDLADNISGWLGDSEYSTVRPAANQALADTRALASIGRQWMDAITSLTQDHSEQTSQNVATLGAEVEQLMKKINSNMQSLMSVAGSGKTGMDFSVTKGKLNDLNVSYDQLLKVISGAAANAGGQGAATQNADPFDSPEMENAGHGDVHADEGDDEAFAVIKEPLDRNGTMQAQLFINKAYKPIAPVSGVVDENWYRGIKAMADDLRKRLQAASAAQDPESAATTALSVNVDKFVRMNSDGTYVLIMSAVDINKLLNFVEQVEGVAESIITNRVSQPHSSLLE